MSSDHSDLENVGSEKDALSVDDRSVDEQALERALNILESPSAESSLASLDDEARQLVELWGLLPYELEEAPVRPELKQQLLQRVAQTAAPAPVAAPQAPPAQPAVAPVVPFARPEAAPIRESPALRWAMAAMLGLCVLGLGFLAGKVQEQSRTIARLDQQLAAQPVAASGIPGMPGISPAFDMSSLHDQFEVIRAVAPRAYPMRPPTATAPVKGGARGIVYVCPRHQRWYLNVKGLGAPPEGMQYRFWFLTEAGPVRGGALVAMEEEGAVLAAESMPPGTKGFELSMEPMAKDDPALTVPALPSEEAIVLRAEEAFAL